MSHEDLLKLLTLDYGLQSQTITLKSFQTEKRIIFSKYLKISSMLLEEYQNVN
jgi:hypothetical protein